MKKLLIIPILALALFTAFAVAPTSSVADDCDSVSPVLLVENAAACGGGTGLIQIWCHPSSEYIGQPNHYDGLHWDGQNAWIVHYDGWYC